MDGTFTLKAAAAAALALLAAGGVIGPALAEDDAALAAPVAATTASEAPAELPRFVPSAEPELDPLASPVAPLAEAEEIAEDIPDGMASWYGPGFAGKRTASGERFDPTEYTAAHRTLPFGSKVRVTHNGRSVVVRINDRGPFHGNRVIDLSQAAAEELGIRRAGQGRVELALLQS
ncbi:MAG TPA: septal ring lytic transglycosylase RlpA family protein [Croceibacterium sp.]|nr:septal ring lytic transglycosylase RlpA family protein [Croceibacterium sp.]